MTVFNYKTIIDDYNEQAFRDCVNQLYPMFNYIVTTRNDIRKIDLEEKLLQLEKNYLLEKEKHYSWVKSKTPVEAFAEEIEYFVDNQFNPGKSVKAYQQKAKNIVKSLKHGEYSIDGLEDLVKIFICFMRCYWPTWKNTNSKLNSFVFDIQSEDSEMLSDFRKHRFIRCSETEGVIRKKTTDYHFLQYSIDYIYIITILIYYRLMQFEGEYYEEELGL